MTPRLLHLVAANAQRVDRPHHGGIAQPAGDRHAFSQPDDARERVDHAKAFAGRPRDQQAAIVGAEVERRIGRAAAIADTQHAPVGASGDRGARSGAADARLRGSRLPGPRRSSQAFPPRRARQTRSRSFGVLDLPKIETSVSATLGGATTPVARPHPPLQVRVNPAASPLHQRHASSVLVALGKLDIWMAPPPINWIWAAS